jgi:hypothetical protein
MDEGVGGTAAATSFPPPPTRIAAANGAETADRFGRSIDS